MWRTYHLPTLAWRGLKLIGTDIVPCLPVYSSGCCWCCCCNDLDDLWVAQNKLSSSINSWLAKKNSIYCLSCVGVVSGEWRATLTRVCGGGGGLRVNTDWLLYIRTLCTLPQSEFDRHSVQIPQCRESLKVALVGGKKTNLWRKESLLPSCLLYNYQRGKVPVNF